MSFLGPEPEKTILSYFNARSMEEINRRVEDFEASHEGAKGYRPTPNLALNVVSSPIAHGREQYDRLLSVEGEVPSQPAGAVPVSFPGGFDPDVEEFLREHFEWRPSDPDVEEFSKPVEVEEEPEVRGIAVAAMPVEAEDTSYVTDRVLDEVLGPGPLKDRALILQQAKYQYATVGGVMPIEHMSVWLYDPSEGEFGEQKPDLFYGSSPSLGGQITRAKYEDIAQANLLYGEVLDSFEDTEEGRLQRARYEENFAREHARTSTFRIAERLRGDLNSIAPDPPDGFAAVRNIALGLVTIGTDVTSDVVNAGKELVRLGREGVEEHVPHGRWVTKALPLVAGPAGVGLMALMDEDVPLRLAQRDISFAKTVRHGNALWQGLKDPYVDPGWGNWLWYVIDAVSLLSLGAGFAGKVGRAGSTARYGVDAADDIAQLGRDLVGYKRRENLVHQAGREIGAFPAANLFPGLHEKVGAAWRGGLDPSDYRHWTSLRIRTTQEREAAERAVAALKFEGASMPQGRRLWEAVASIPTRLPGGVMELGAGYSRTDTLLSRNAAVSVYQQAVTNFKNKRLEPHYMVPYLDVGGMRRGAWANALEKTFLGTQNTVTRKKAYDMGVMYGIHTHHLRRDTDWNVRSGAAKEGMEHLLQHSRINDLLNRLPEGRRQDILPYVRGADEALVRRWVPRARWRHRKGMREVTHRHRDKDGNLVVDVVDYVPTARESVEAAMFWRFMFPELNAEETVALVKNFHENRKGKYGVAKEQAEERRLGIWEPDEAKRTELLDAIDRDIRKYEDSVALHAKKLKLLEGGGRTFEWLKRADEGLLEGVEKELYDVTADVLDSVAEASRRVGLTNPQEEWRINAARAVYQGKEITSESPILKVDRLLRDTEIDIAELEERIAKLPANAALSRKLVEKEELREKLAGMRDNPDLQLDPFDVYRKEGMEADFPERAEFDQKAPPGARYVPAQNEQVFVGEAKFTSLSAETPNLASGERLKVLPGQPPNWIRHDFKGRSLYIGDFRLDVSSMSAEMLRASWIYAQRVAHYEELWADGLPSPKGLDPRYALPIRDHRTSVSSLDEEWGKVNNELSKALEEGRFEAHDGTSAVGFNRWQDGLSEHGGIPANVFPAKYNSAESRYEDVANFGADGVPTQFEGRAPEQWSNALLAEAKAGTVRFVDSRWLIHGQGTNRMWRGKARSKGDLLLRGWARGNGYVRDAQLYWRPAYATNIVGAAVMSFMTDGFASPGNLARALNKGDLYGDDVANIIKSLAGTGRVPATAPAGVARSVVRTKINNMWNEVTDARFREAAVIGELKRKKIAFTVEALEDPANARKIKEAARRARRSMVDFDGLLPFEREYLRHLFFIYTWQTRSFAWAFHTLLDRPVKSRVLGTVGTAEEEEIDELVGGEDAVAKLTRGMARGDWVWYAKGMDVGDRATISLAQVNPFGVIPEGGALVHSLFERSRFNGLDDAAGPLARLTGFVFGGGASSFSDPAFPLLGEGTLGGVAGRLLSFLPQFRPGIREREHEEFAEKGQDLPSVITGGTQTAPQEEFMGFLRQYESAPYYDPIQGGIKEYYTLLFASLTPRERNQFSQLLSDLQNLAAEDPDGFFELNRTLGANWMLAQAEFIEHGPLTPGLRTVADFGAELKRQEMLVSEDAGGNPVEGNMGLTLQVHIQTLLAMEERGLLDKDFAGTPTHKEAMKNLNEVKKTEEGDGELPLQRGLRGLQLVQEYLGDALDEYSRFKAALRDMGRFVREQESGADILNYDWDKFKESDLFPETFDDDEVSRFERLLGLNDIGRRKYAIAYTSYLEEQFELDGADLDILTGDQRDEQERAAREFSAREGERPIVLTIEGKEVELPSPEEAQWVLLPHDARKAKIASFVGKSGAGWQKLAPAERKRAGYPVRPEARDPLREILSSPEFWDLPKTLKKQTIVDNDVKYPGLLESYMIGEQRKGERWMGSVSYSGARYLWNNFTPGEPPASWGIPGHSPSFVVALQTMLDTLNQHDAQLGRGAITRDQYLSMGKQVKDKWKEYVDEVVIPYLQQQNDLGDMVHTDILLEATSHSEDREAEPFFYGMID